MKKNELKLSKFIKPLVTMAVSFTVTIIFLLIVRSKLFSNNIIASGAEAVMLYCFTIAVFGFFIVTTFGLSISMIKESVATLKLENLGGIKKIFRTIFSVALIATSALIMFLTISLGVVLLINGLDAMKLDPASLALKLNLVSGTIINSIIGFEFNPVLKTVAEQSAIGPLFWTIFSFTIAWSGVGIVASILTSRREKIQKL